MKIYVTKHALKFKGTPTGISEHDLPEEEISKASTEKYLYVPGVGYCGPRGFETAELKALNKAMAMIGKKTKALVKELEKFDEQRAAIKGRIQELDPTHPMREKLELDVFWSQMP